MKIRIEIQVNTIQNGGFPWRLVTGSFLEGSANVYKSGEMMATSHDLASNGGDCKVNPRISGEV